MSSNIIEMQHEVNGFSVQEKHLISLLANLKEKDYPDNSQIQQFKKRAQQFINQQGEFISGTAALAKALLNDIQSEAAQKIIVLSSARKDFYQAAQENDPEGLISHLQSHQQIDAGYQVNSGYGVDLDAREKVIATYTPGDQELCGARRQKGDGKENTVSQLSRKTYVGGRVIVVPNGNSTDYAALEENFNILNDTLTAKGFADLQTGSAVTSLGAAFSVLDTPLRTGGVTQISFFPNHNASHSGDYSTFRGKKGTYSVGLKANFAGQAMQMSGWFRLEDGRICKLEDYALVYLGFGKIPKGFTIKDLESLRDSMLPAFATTQISSRTKLENHSSVLNTGHSTLVRMKTSNQLAEPLVRLDMVTQEKLSVYGREIFSTENIDGKPVRVLNVSQFKEAYEIARQEDEALIFRMNQLHREYKAICVKEADSNPLLGEIEERIVRHLICKENMEALSQDQEIVPQYSLHIDAMTAIDLYQNMLNLLAAQQSKDIDAFYAALESLQEISDFSGSNDLTAHLDLFLREQERLFYQGDENNPKVIEKLEKRLEAEKAALEALELDKEEIKLILTKIEADSQFSLLDKVELCDIIHRLLVCPKEQTTYLWQCLAGIIKDESDDLWQQINTLLELSTKESAELEARLRVKLGQQDGILLELAKKSVEDENEIEHEVSIESEESEHKRHDDESKNIWVDSNLLVEENNSDSSKGKEGEKSEEDCVIVAIEEIDEVNGHEKQSDVPANSDGKKHPSQLGAYEKEPIQKLVDEISDEGYYSNVASEAFEATFNLYRPVDLSGLQALQENGDDAVKKFGVLRIVQKKGETVNHNREQVILDIGRDLGINGQSLAGKVSADTPADIEVLQSFGLEEEQLDHLSEDYQQGVADPVSHVGNTISSRIPNVFILKSLLSSGSILINKDSDNSDAVSVTWGVYLQTIDPDEGIKLVAIPGEVLVTTKKHPEGGAEILSMLASNQLLQKLLRHTLGESLQVYGYELIDALGNLNQANLTLAINNGAKQEEILAQRSLDQAITEFKDYCGEQEGDLKALLESIPGMIERHMREKGKVYNKHNLINGAYVATLNTAVATTIYCDLPAVLSGKKNIEDCPMLLKAIVWCGDPELSTAIKEVLKPIIDADPEQFKQLVALYGSGDSTADWAQAYQEATRDGKDPDRELTAQYTDFLLKKEAARPFQGVIESLRAETKKAEKDHIISAEVAADTLHKVNRELINCVHYCQNPKRSEFKPVFAAKDWNQLKQDSVAAVSRRKKWASRALLIVGGILAVGFLVGLGVVTAGVAPAVIIAVGAAIAPIVSPTIAAAAVGLVATSGIISGLGLEGWHRNDIKRREARIDGIKDKVDTLQKTRLSEAAVIEINSHKSNGEVVPPWSDPKRKDVQAPPSSPKPHREDEEYSVKEAHAKTETTPLLIKPNPWSKGGPSPVLFRRLSGKLPPPNDATEIEGFTKR